jgi:thiamine-monophosphate kinase
VANAGADLPEVDEAWLEAFSDSLFVQLNYYDMQLIGGDTTRGPLSMTLGIHGFVPPGALKRSGAKPGDWIYVTGTPETAPPVWRFCRIGCGG